MLERIVKDNQIIILEFLTALHAVCIHSDFHIRKLPRNLERFISVLLCSPGCIHFHKTLGLTLVATGENRKTGFRMRCGQESQKHLSKRSLARATHGDITHAESRNGSPRRLLATGVVSTVTQSKNSLINQHR